MTPIVPEVVGVGKIGNAALYELPKAYITGIACRGALPFIIEGDTVAGIAYLELEQVVVLEQHRSLDR